MVRPTVPQNVSEYARACLHAVAGSGLGTHLSLGGAFGLSHYLEYRLTNDIDAWWTEVPQSDVRDRVISAIRGALERFGSVRVRTWGDVTSIELSVAGHVVFSFQIARRTALLGEEIVGLWPGGVRLDGFSDIVASKMVALINRGAPRDFRDIHALVKADLISARECWDLWEGRQKLAREDTDRRRAALAIRSHLARIESVRPLESIESTDQRAEAAQVRGWIAKELLGEPSH